METQVYVNPRINQQIYLKDPLASDLGIKMIKSSVEMIHQLGYESFNFKKLGAHINSTEASVYRYFPNKQRILIYLAAWYWESLNYQIKFQTKGVSDPREKLAHSIKILVYITEEMDNHSLLHLSQIQSIVIEQFYKILRTKNITEHNECGYFESFKRLCATLASIINEIDPEFKYPMTMSTSLVEMSINNRFCCNNLPSLTEIKCTKNQRNQIEDMINYFCSRLLKNCD